MLDGMEICRDRSSVLKLVLSCKVSTVENIQLMIKEPCLKIGGRLGEVLLE